jgi:putative ABC transport system permease protein
VLLHDLRYALRTLSSQRLFTAAAVLTLALGIGANTALFAVIDAVLLRPLPYRDAARVVVLWSHWTGWKKTWLSEPELADYRREMTSFDAVAGFSFAELNLTAGGDSIRIRACRAQAEIFQVLGIGLIAGRAFTGQEDQPARANVAVLSEHLWKSHFGGDPGAIGRRIQLDGSSYDVIGVIGGDVRLPTDYAARLSTDIWLPAALGTPDPSDRDNHGLFAVARLKPGATLTAAQAEINRLTTKFIGEWPRLYEPDFGVTLVPAPKQVFGDVAAALMVLLLAVGAVLLIACANVTNLLLTRAEWRQKEFAIRAALGADRSRIVRQLVTEALVLSLTGAIAGAILAVGLIRIFVAIDPVRIPRALDVAPDERVLASAAALAIACTLLVGLLPAWRAGRGAVQTALSLGGRWDHAARAGVGRSLLAGQMAASVALVAVALLLTRSFARLIDVDPGFDAAHVLTFRTSLPDDAYRDGAAVVRASAEIRRRLTDVAGAIAVGGVTGLPLATVRGDTSLRIENQPAVRGSADWQVVTPGYFEALKTPLRAGRLFTDADQSNTTAVAVVNNALVRTYFSGRSPVGRRIALGLDRGWCTIVGVVADVHHRGLDAPPRAEAYRPHAQFRFGGAQGRAVTALTWALRSIGDPLALAASARTAVRAVDPDLGVSDVRTLQEVLNDSTSDRRLDAVLANLFGILAVVLTSVGVYGVVAYTVSRRTKEIGLRLAVGARTADVWRMLVVEIGRLAAVGISIGAAIAFTAGRLVRSLLFEADGDVWAVTTAAIVVGAVCVVTAVAAGRRATAIDPATALTST